MYSNEFYESNDLNYKGEKRYFVTKEENEKGAEFDEGDIRVLLIAEKAINIKREWKLNAPLNGCEKAMQNYRWLKPPISVFLQIIIFLKIFFSHPAWCENMLAKIDSDCRVMFDGVSIIRSPMPLMEFVSFKIGVTLAIYS